MILPPLVKAQFIRRYKRFLADCMLEDGTETTVYCPNTGSMLGCMKPGCTIFCSRSSNPDRKYPLTWELSEMDNSLVGINTGKTNTIVQEALEAGAIAELAPCSQIQTEVTTSPGTRLDFSLQDSSGTPCYMEVKNCTLVRDSVASFPDAITTRGQKHIQELIRLQQSGARAVLFFLVQREDGTSFTPAADIDPEYARLLTLAKKQGVQILAYAARLSLEEITLGQKLPVALRMETDN